MDSYEYEKEISNDRFGLKKHEAATFMKSIHELLLQGLRFAAFTKDLSSLLFLILQETCRDIHAGAKLRDHLVDAGIDLR